MTGVQTCALPISISNIFFFWLLSFNFQVSPNFSTIGINFSLRVVAVSDELVHVKPTLM